MSLLIINPYVVFIERAGHNNIDKTLAHKTPKPVLHTRYNVADVIEKYCMYKACIYLYVDQSAAKMKRTHTMQVSKLHHNMHTLQLLRAYRRM